MSIVRSPSSLYLELARTRLADGQQAEAEAAYLCLLQGEPGNLEALHFMVMRCREKADAVTALQWLRVAAANHPGHVSVQCSLGSQLHEGGLLDEAWQVFMSIARRVPQAPAPRLYLGQLCEQRGQKELALRYFFRAITLAQMQGLWNDRASTPEPLLSLVTHAILIINTQRRALFEQLLKPLRDQHGETALRRVSEGLAMYLGDEPLVTTHAMQKPKFFYVPGLGDAPFADAGRFDWIPWLQAETASIRDEALAVLNAAEGIEPFLKLSTQGRQQDYLGLRDGQSAWDAFFFWRHGVDSRDNLTRCPNTAAALNRLPLSRIPAHAPEVCFSILKPGTHILPHHGVTNTRLVAHLPLLVPQDCALRVADQTHVWREGEVVVFDDTYEHEAWNHSDAARMVMIFDVWHPALTTVEREAISTLVIGIGAFNDSVEAL